MMEEREKEYQSQIASLNTVLINWNTYMQKLADAIAKADSLRQDLTNAETTVGIESCLDW